MLRILAVQGCFTRAHVDAVTVFDTPIDSEERGDLSELFVGRCVPPRPPQQPGDIHAWAVRALSRRAELRFCGALREQ